MSVADPPKRRWPGAPAAGRAPATGLRARKKQKTREAIQRAALRLFTRQGYDETTVEDIAAAAEISPSTFFNYFPTKEDVVLYDMYDPIAIGMVLNQPQDEPLPSVARRVLQGLGEIFEADKEAILARGKIMMAVPELRSRMWDQIEQTQQIFVNALARRTGRKATDFELRVVTRSFIGAMYEAAMEWFRSNGRERLDVIADRALTAMERGAELRTIGRPPRTPRARPQR